MADQRAHIITVHHQVQANFFAFFTLWFIHPDNKAAEYKHCLHENFPGYLSVANLDKLSGRFHLANRLVHQRKRQSK